uniref:Uncharacterized protein n=1 Tax=Rhizophora mucronata TaxID=61149 RepID=A0A2P2PFV8_RHIMU
MDCALYINEMVNGIGGHFKEVSFVVAVLFNHLALF